MRVSEWHMQQGQLQAWLTGHVVGGQCTILRAPAVSDHRPDCGSLALQVLLTGKPCRNFQVLVAYSMLQMVRLQVLQESMTGEHILLVRGPPAKPSPAPPLPSPDTDSGPHAPWAIPGD